MNICYGEIEELKSRIESLSEEITRWKGKCTVLEGQVGSMEKGKEELQELREQALTSSRELNVTVQTQLKEIESLKVALVAKEDELKVVRSAQNKVQVLKRKNEQLDSEVQNQRRQVEELISVKDENMELINKQTSIIEKLKKKVQRQVSKLRDAERQVLDAKTEEKPAVTPEEILPSAALRCDIFDTVLASHIEKIAAVVSLPPVAKIQSIYKAIHQYYGQKISEYDVKLSDASKDMERLQKAMGQFLANSSVLLPVKHISMEAFVRGEGCESQVSAITDMRASCDDIRRNRDILASFVKHLQETFGFEVTSDPT